MKCERALELIHRSEIDADSLELGFARDHVNACEDCQAAAESIRWLRHEAESRVPVPRPGAADRAIRNAITRGEAASRNRTEVSRRPFFGGILVGAAMAAAAAYAVVFMLPRTAPMPSTVTPQISMAANEQRDISIALAAENRLEGAEIRVVLNGSIELSGFAGQKELRWLTDLDAGANQLTLPIVAVGGDGGQLLVEVTHGQKFRRFLVDIDGAG
jgi:hypothetical protein